MLHKLETTINWVFYNNCKPLMPREFMGEKLLCTRKPVQTPCTV